MDSILTSIKKMLGIDWAYDSFDADIIMQINSAFAVLSQIGVDSEDGFGTEEIFRIEDSNRTWEEFQEASGLKNVELIKNYIYFKVKQAFDPPSSSAAMEAINRQISELEWRINISADKG